MEVDVRVDDESGAFHLAVAIERVAVAVNGENVARPHLGPMQPERGQQETFAHLVQGIAEVVADALAQPEAVSQPHGRGQIHLVPPRALVQGSLPVVSQPRNVA